MPDWSYRTVLRPMMMALGPERARRLAAGTLATLSRLPGGLAAIDFLGHMQADGRLKTKAGLTGPIALGSMIDPEGRALRAFGRFGAGLIEVGPVDEQPATQAQAWQIDLATARITPAGTGRVADAETVARSLEAATGVPSCVRIAGRDAESVRRIANRLHAATWFSVDAGTVQDARERVAAAGGTRPVLLRVDAASPNATALASAAIESGAAGIWLYGDADHTASAAQALRKILPDHCLIVAAGVIEPDDARRLLHAGADMAVVEAGLICSGPGLIKRCNEALVSLLPPPPPPEPLSLDAARRAWLWGFLLGIGMFAGGVLALIIASTRVVLPYDEAISGMSRAQLMALNPRLLAFMAHDRVSLAGAMLSIGIFYASLAWFGIRKGAHWAHATIIVSAVVGFFTFFLFLGFGYFDPFHAFVTAILTQFTLLCLTMQPSPLQPSPPEWRETSAWRRGQWGQLLFIVIGAVLTGAGVVIAAIGSTSVFVHTDLEFLRITAAELHRMHERLVPLVAHDRASLGGMLISNGLAIWLSAQWGFRAGAGWLWTAFAWGGNLAFACAVVVHLVVGYASLLHLAPAFAGWAVWNVALLLSRSWLVGDR